MRILKKIIKKLYHLIWFLGAFVLFSPHVNAVGGVVSINGEQFGQASFASFGDVSNNNVTDVGAVWVDYGSYYRSGSSIVTTGGNNNGASIGFDAAQPFVYGYTYVVSILIGFNNGYPKASDGKVCIAESIGNARTRWNNDWCVSASVMNTEKQSPYVANSVQYNYGLLNYVFTSNVTGTSILVDYQSSVRNESNHTFGGYKVTLLSDNKQLTQQQVQQAVQNSGLATAQSVTQVQQSITQVQQELSGVQQEQQQTNQKLDDVNDNLTDETAPVLDLSDLDVSSDTPISDLITMPLTILNSLSQALDGTCSNYTIPFLFSSSVTFPCFTISDYLGNTVTNYIDLFICFYMCYNIAMLVVSVFEDITSLRDIYDSLYVPKHADTGYQPRHAKGGGN